MVVGERPSTPLFKRNHPTGRLPNETTSPSLKNQVQGGGAFSRLKGLAPE